MNLMQYWFFNTFNPILCEGKSFTIFFCELLNYIWTAQILIQFSYHVYDTYYIISVCIPWHDSRMADWVSWLLNGKTGCRLLEQIYGGVDNKTLVIDFNQIYCNHLHLSIAQTSIQHGCMWMYVLNSTYCRK